MTREGGVPGSGPRQNVAVLFSERSRRLYVEEALARGAVYEFVDARGRTRRWLKEEHAYLAPPAASAFLNRCSVKHDRLDEGELREAGDAYHTILIPNAAALEDETVERLSAAVGRGALRLVVTGRTNLPDDLLGLERSATIRPQGYACWRWNDCSRFSDRQAWGEFHAAGGRGYTARRVAARPGTRVLARLWGLSGDLSSPAAATREEIGDAIVVTDRTVTVASSVFEFLGGVLQAHLDVEDIRHWRNPVHWGDTLVLFLWDLLREWHPAILEQRLKPFGSHRGAFSLRHDVDSSADLSMLEFQVAQLVPATYDILDPVIAADSTTAADAALWVREVGKHSFLEAGLHNDSLAGDPPRHVVGTGFLEHVRATEARLGFTIRTCGRHGGGHVHPETLDAMDYLLENAPEVLGTCTFCFYNMVEYGRRSYQTNGSVTIASSGFWFPFHPVITSVEEHKVLRGWDRTHEYDCDFDLIDVILAAHHSSTPVPPRPAGPRLPPWIFDAARGSRDREHGDQLDNGVYTLQYHPLFARDPAVNHGRGTLDYLIYAVSQAERRNLWIASQRMLYERMRDYEAVRFRVEAPDRVTVFNPTERRIEGLMVESAAPVGHVLADGLRHIHVVAGRYFGVPPLEPHRGITMHTVPELAPCPQILNTTSRGLRILDARHDPRADAVSLDLEVARRQALCLWNLEPGAELRIRVREGDAVRESALKARPEGIAKVPLAGPESGFARQSVEITTAARIG